MPEPAIRCRGLVKRYGPVTALDGVDLEVGLGECFGLLGPNGAGKTTAVEVLVGLLPPDEGEVRVLGRSWAGDAEPLRERIGVAFQETQLIDKLSVEETVRLFASFYRSPRPVDEVIRELSLDEKRRAWLGKLSGGQRQRVAVACALVGDPELLFLDEPTTGLDPHSRREVWELVAGFKARQRTVVLTTHYMDEAERLCDRVAVIDHGKVIALGRPADLIAGLGGDQIIEISAAQPMAPESLASLPGVRAVRRTSDASTQAALTVTELHRALPSLLSSLSAHGVQLTRLETHHASLEDVFVSLTGRHLEDGA